VCHQPPKLICLSFANWQLCCSSQFHLTLYNSNNTHTHTRLTALFSGLPRSAGTSKVKRIWILLKQETVSGSSISWAMCKSAPRSRQITTPAPHHSFYTGRMPFLPPNQQCKRTEGITTAINTVKLAPTNSDGTIYRIVSNITNIEYHDTGGISYHIHITIITAQTNSIFCTTLVSCVVGNRQR